VSREARLALELRVESPGGRSRRYRLGGLASVVVLLAALAIFGGVALGLASLPSLLAASRDRREMNVALERRSQYGDRLRALVVEYAALDRQVREHADRVDRIRRLYGLPELPAAVESETAARREPRTIFDGAILHARRVDLAIEANLARTDALLAILARWERDRPAEVRAVPAILPLRAAEAVPVSGFGRRRDPVSGELEFHAGIDFAAPAGATVRAPSDATVRWAGEPPTNAGEAWWRLGRVVVLAHGDQFRTVFGHCDRILVRRGQRIAVGTPIATVGTSGWTATPRLHYEVRRPGSDASWTAIDPATLVIDPQSALLQEGMPAAAEKGTEPDPPPLPRSFER